MYTNLYVYEAPRLFMAGKLYWRIKKDGKWTWKPCSIMEMTEWCDRFEVTISKEEEE